MNNLLTIDLARTLVDERMRVAECARMRREARSPRAHDVLARIRRHSA